MNQWNVLLVLLCLGFSSSQPNPPEGLVAIEQRTTSILISWQSQPDTIYLVAAEHFGNDLTSCSGGDSVEGNSIRINNTVGGSNLNQRAEYTAAVCAVNSSGSIPSAPAVIDVVTGPRSPDKLKLTESESDSILVTWSDTDPNIEPKVNGYLVEWMDFYSRKVLGDHFVSSAGPMTYTITGLMPSSLFEVVVTTRTTDETVYSDQSVDTRATIPAAPDITAGYDPPRKTIYVAWTMFDSGDIISNYYIWTDAPDGSKDSFRFRHRPGNYVYCSYLYDVTEDETYNITVAADNNWGLNQASTFVFTDSTLPSPDPDQQFCDTFSPTAAIPVDESTVPSTYKSTAVNTDQSYVETTFPTSTTSSETTFAESTTKLVETTTAFDPPNQPEFDCKTSLTTMDLTWTHVEGRVDFYKFQLVSDLSSNVYEVNSSMTQLRLSEPEVYPYTDYVVYMYSVIIINGDEISSEADIEKCTTYSDDVFCPRSIVPHTVNNENVNVTFPQTQAGYSNSSEDVCPTQTKDGGQPLGTRHCTLFGKWEEPNWLTSCETTLESLASTNITDDEERDQVASDLVILTSNSSSLTEEDVQNSVETVESIVNAEELNQNTSNLVVESVGNILTAAEKDSNVTESLLASLDEVAAKVILENDEEYQSVSSSIAMAVVKNYETTSGIGYKKKYNPVTESNGFSDGQFEIYRADLILSNSSSSIFIPEEAIAMSKDGRVSFYAFLDDSAFQVNNDSNSETTNQIPRSSLVQSRNVFSASVVDAVVENLKENVTIKFEIDLVSCTKSTSGKTECGEYLCGFWDEVNLFWSNRGCSLTNMDQNFVECQCNHLTNFATLFAYGGADYSNNIGLDIVTLVGCSISAIGSLFTVIALIIVWNERKAPLPKKSLFVILNMSLSLFFLYGFLLISFVEDVYKDEDACTAIAVILHFFLFSSLSWMMVEALDVCLRTAQPFSYQTISKKKLFICSCLWGWGFPLVFVGLSAGLELSTYQGSTSDTTCWLVTDMIPFLVIIPSSVIILINIIAYIVVVKLFVSRKFQSKQQREAAVKNIFFSFFLFVLFGISWVFGFLLFEPSAFSEVFAYIFSILTSLQGIAIFVLFVVRNKEIRKSIRSHVEKYSSKLSSQNPTTVMTPAVSRTTTTKKSYVNYSSTSH